MARRLGLLPQAPVAPDGITVADLVARGRYPISACCGSGRATTRRRSWSDAATSDPDLADRFVDELSGGQRQRVWLAMVLAQQTPILLLDEPTTFLDIAHQLDMLDLCADLHERRGRTLVAVLHDLNHACRYATHLIVMKDGGILAQGHPRQIVTAELVHEAFGLSVRSSRTPRPGRRSSCPPIEPGGVATSQVPVRPNEDVRCAKWSNTL